MELLSDEYTFETVYPINELRLWHVPEGEALYNFAISRSWTSFTNWVVRHFPEPIFKQREKKTQKMFERHIERMSPDLIISVTPFINYPGIKAAEAHGLPFILVTTDNDLKTWSTSLEKQNYSQFKVTIGYDLPTSKGLLLDKNVPEESIETIGLPLRPSFLEPHSRKDLRHKYEIPDGKKVVLIMMGGVGAKSSYQYAKAIGENSLNMHMIVCAGKSSHAAAKFKKIKLAKGNTMDLIPFTEKIHELFYLSDLLLTKSGPGTMNEAFAAKLPILIDQTNESLFWEKPNIDLVLSKKVGACVHSYKEAPELVKRYLYDEEMRETIAQAYEDVEQNQFAERIKPLIEELCGEPATGEVQLASRSMATSPFAP